MKLSIITDEISQDPETAAELAVNHWGIRNLEIREIWGKRIPDIDEEQRGALIDIMNLYGARIVAISPGIFKVPASEDEVIMNHLNVRLMRSFELAKDLGTTIIIVFSPIRGETPENEIVQGWIPHLGAAAKAARGRDLYLALENEHDCLADTGANAAGLVRTVQNERLLINWDPCNALFAGEDPFPKGYLEVRGFLGHVHLKDCVINRTNNARRYVPIGEGEIKAKPLLEQLRTDRYQGYISVETHFRPKVKGSKECLDGLRNLLRQIGENEE